MALYASRSTSFLFCGASAFVWAFVDLASGHIYSHTLIPFWNTCVRLGFFLLITNLLIDLKSHLRQKEILASSDGLTELLNARAFKEACRSVLALAVRKKRPLALGYIDIDGFKQINDVLGHSEGDRALVTIATTLRQCVRVADILGRLGGDEFAILLPETDFKGAQIIFGRIHQVLRRAAEESGLSITFSIGVAVFINTPPAINEALKIADELMYRVKMTGKNDVFYKELPEIQ